MTEYADPEKYFALSFSLSAVRYEDYAEVKRALEDVRNRYARGGSSLGILSVNEKAVINR